MARKLRLEYPGACYHVINRGNYRRNIFASAGSGEAFERCLVETCERFGWRVHAFVVMRNHFHMALETPEANLSLGMKFLQGTWANRFNRFHGLTGRPFQGRFKALHVEPGTALAQVAHYIHLNPLRAKAVSAERFESFRLSSLWWFPRKDRPRFLDPATVLKEAGGLADAPVGWKCYREYLLMLAEEDPTERERRFGKLSTGWAVGSEEFRRELIEDLRQQGADLQQAERLGESAGERQALREEIWEERLSVAASAAGLEPAKLGPKKSSREKVLLATALKTATDVSNGWLCERLQMGTPASVSQFVRRFLQAGGAQSKQFKAALSRLKP
jgi:REP element-mobilizing transposase RayT